MIRDSVSGVPGEENMTNSQRDEKRFLEEPIQPDEGWWAAVLADEPCIEEESEPVETVLVSEPRCTESSTSSVNWDKIEAIYDSDEITHLNVVGYNRGGVLVASEDVHGFVPASHLVDIPPETTDAEREQYFVNYLDRKLALKVIECEPEKERVVFSERAALAGEGKRKELLDTLSAGMIVSGNVTNVTDFGIFVDLGGLEGLIHVSELSWGRVQHPSDILNIGDETRTLVLQVSEDRGRVALSLKRLEDNPWETLAATLSPGDTLHAEITSIVKYGAFARLDAGVEGLIHISSMNFPTGCTRIEDFLFEGQSVMVCVLHIDAKKRRLGLKLESF
jgi:small subunit ribosomal protein S1